MDLFNFLIFGLDKYPALYVFLGTFFFGDEMVYFFSFLSGQGIINLGIVILFSIIGNGGCDIFWFSVARSKYADKFKKMFILRNKKIDKDLAFGAMNKKKICFLLLFSKFFYGTRLLAIFYVAGKEKSFKKIIFYNTFAVVVWIIIIAPLVWLIGKWTSVSFDVLNSIHKTIGFAILFVILFYVLNVLVISRIIRNLINQKKFPEKSPTST